MESFDDSSSPLATVVVFAAPDVMSTWGTRDSEVVMSTGSVVKNDERVDDRTSHAIAAAQLRGEAKAEGLSTRLVVWSVAEEIAGIGLEPDVDELARRYNAGETTVPSWMRQREAG
jgi:hypothetical protein